MKKGFIVIALALATTALLGLIIFSQKKPTEKPAELPSPTISPSPTSTPVPTPSPNSTIKPTPKPKPSPSPSPKSMPTIIPVTSLDILFAKYGSEYGVNPDLLKKIAKCESGLDPTSVNGDYAGLFQFASRTWVAARGRMGLNSDLNLRANPEESTRTAAYYIAQNGTNAWANCD